jgi:hypothetical protein
MSIEPGRIRQPRSDLVCHHLEDACAISGVCCVEKCSLRADRAGELRCRLGRRRPIPSLIVPFVGEQRPDDAGILVRERHGGDVGIAPRG